MKITAIQTHLLTGPCTLDPFLSQARRVRSAAFIEIHTDGGVRGLGETYAGYFCPEVVPAIVEFFAPNPHRPGRGRHSGTVAADVSLRQLLVPGGRGRERAQRHRGRALGSEGEAGAETGV